MSYCTYTAQGSLVCKEAFTVREDTNEKEASNPCVSISKAFIPIANLHKCDVSADIDACKFGFSCNKASESCANVNTAFSEVAMRNGCSIDADVKSCKFSYKCK